jgi:hypothetical protein
MRKIKRNTKKSKLFYKLKSINVQQYKIKTPGEAWPGARGKNGD